MPFDMSAIWTWNLSVIKAIKILADTINFNIGAKKCVPIKILDQLVQSCSLIRLWCRRLCFSLERPANTMIRLCGWEYAMRLTLKAPRKPASENVVSLCRLLNILANFSHLFFAYRQPVWTQIRLLLKGAVWSGSTLFAEVTFKVTSRRQSRRQ